MGLQICPKFLPSQPIPPSTDFPLNTPFFHLPPPSQLLSIPPDLGIFPSIFPYTSPTTPTNIFPLPPFCPPSHSPSCQTALPFPGCSQTSRFPLLLLPTSISHTNTISLTSAALLLLYTSPASTPPSTQSPNPLSPFLSETPQTLFLCQSLLLPSSSPLNTGQTPAFLL